MLAYSNKIPTHSWSSQVLLAWIQSFQPHRGVGGRGRVLLVMLSWHHGCKGCQPCTRCETDAEPTTQLLLLTALLLHKLCCPRC